MKGCGCCVPWLRVGGPGAGGRGQGAGVASGDSRRMVHDTVNRGDVVSTSSPGIALPPIPSLATKTRRRVPLSSRLNTDNKVEHHAILPRLLCCR